jgi:hypothetical protein
MTEQALAQRIHDPLAGPFQGDNLKKIRHKPDDDNHKEKRGDPAYSVHPLGGRQGSVEYIFIHGQLNESWPHKTHAGYDKGKTNGRKDPLPLGNYEFE